MSLNAAASAYVPKWMKTADPPAAPVAKTVPPPTYAPSRAPKTAPTPTLTANGKPPTPFGGPGDSSALAVRTPGISPGMSRLPTRMSPIMAPYSGKSTPHLASMHMNPNAAAFTPSGGAQASGCFMSLLPSSTTQLANEQQKQEQLKHGAGGESGAAEKQPTPKWTVQSTFVPYCASGQDTAATAATGTPSIRPVAVSNLGVTAPVTVNKTAEEILEISRRSNLKVAAPVFMPGRRTLNRVALQKESPLITPSSPDEEMLLFDAWCLYYLAPTSRESTKVDNFDPTLVFRIDSVPTFWKVFNNIPVPTELRAPSTMYLFRDDINPKWEDPKNRKGGAWKVKVDARRIDEVWLQLACRTIGESWAKHHRNAVNGIVLKVRERGNWIEVWVSDRHEDFPQDLLSAVQNVLSAFNIDYYTHEEVQEKIKEATESSKGKRQFKNKRR